jgi:hypothetical protein
MLKDAVKFAAGLFFSFLDYHIQKVDENCFWKHHTSACEQQ